MAVMLSCGGAIRWYRDTLQPGTPYEQLTDEAAQARTDAIFLPYLVILTLIAGILRGVVGVSAVVLTQILSMSLAISAWAPGTDAEAVLRVMSPWLLTSIGAGLLGAWLHGAWNVPHTADRDAPYAAAHRLLTQLRVVARRLSSGLDPVTIATSIRTSGTTMSEFQRT